MFEISIVLRDQLGEPICTPEGIVRRKTFYANSGDELYDLWVRNSVKKKGKRTENKKEKEKSSKGNKDAAQDRQEAPQEQELETDL